jgi:tetratricopeptide (TPR) repeat protein
MQRVLGKEHPDTLRTSVDLAASYRESGQSSQAEVTFIGALSAQRKLLGDGHPDTLAAMAGLAELYVREGKHEPAQTLLLEAVRGRRRVLGPQHPDTVEAVSQLGWLYVQQHEYAEAAALLNDVTIRDGSSTDTFFRFQGESALGAALAAERKYADAEKLLIEGYEGMFERLDTVPAPSRTVLERAGRQIVHLYEDWGKPERAIEWREKLSVHK